MREKICEQCGRAYIKPYKFSIGQWLRNKFCGRECSRLAMFGHKWNLGHKVSKETRRKIGKANSVSLLGNIPWNKGYKGYNSGEKHPNWNKPHTPETRERIKIARWGKNYKAKEHKNPALEALKKERNRHEYSIWRRKVLEKYNRTCVWCGSTERPEADHIKRFVEFPELRYDVKNGRVLCHECHKKSDGYGGRGYKRLHLTT